LPFPPAFCIFNVVLEVSVKYRSVLFDLDGTLVDSRQGILNGFKHAMTKLLGESWDGRLPEDYIGPPLRATFMDFYGMSAAQTEEAVRLYREYYRPKGIYECAVYPHVKELLEGIRSAGAGVWLATSKARVFAETVLEHTGLMRFFAGVAGSELDGTMDKKTEVIRHLLDTMMPPGGLPALMVGDRWHDAKGAQDCSMDFAAALWGFGSRGEFEPYACAGMFSDASDLHRWLMGEARE
jgi:phosphoglycolate phosphatase